MGIMTVNGVIDKEALGITSPHEHALIDIRNQFPGDLSPDAFGIKNRVEATHYALLMSDPYALRDNLVLDDEDLAIREVARFAQAGGRTFVDVTPPGIGRNIPFLLRLSAQTGLNVVAPTGFYTADTHPQRVRRMSVEALADEMTRELTVGIGDTLVKAGIIGEIGTSQTLFDEEIKVLRAAALANQRTGTPVMVHLNPWAQHGQRVIDILEEGGMRPEQICICHMDVLLDLKDMRGVLDRGVYLEFDNFGKEFTSGSAYGRFPSDAERVEVLYQLIEDGYARQLLLACDVCLKNLLRVHGGPGYDHILVDIKEMIRRDRPADFEVFSSLLMENPARYLDNTRLDTRSKMKM